MRGKFYKIALALCGLITLAACGNYSKKSEDLNKFLIKEGVALTCNMDELAESEEYLALITPSENIGQIANKMASQEYSKPENAYLIKMPDDILTRVQGFPKDLKISDNLMKMLRSKVNGSVFANMVNASYGSEVVAATAITSYGKSYIQPEGWSDDMILLLEYPGEFSSIVSFVQSGDGVISGSSIFVKNGDKDLLASIAEYLGVEDLKYDHYTGSQLKD